VTAQRLDGKVTAQAIRDELRPEVERLMSRGVRPGLGVVLVGDHPASAVYVRSKTRACEELGMHHETRTLPSSTTTEEVVGLVEELNRRPEIHGILVQLPLPPHVDATRVLDLVDPAKDVDGFHPRNVGLLQQRRPGLRPCTPAGVMELLLREGIAVEGRRAVVVGRSDIVGKPMATMLLHAHATVTICHSRTRDLAAVTREAEILVAAAGVRSLIGPDHVAEGAVVVDVGMHRVTDRAVVEQLYPGNRKKLAAYEKKGAVLAGDVDFERVLPKAARITPVPGGVGPLTIAMLMVNTLGAARARRGV
jgi:methylenetetrahydrofolate dehydrogenase (NADP+)/methenyltetrahydrofolate cyclohydrolase